MSVGPLRCPEVDEHLTAFLDGELDAAQRGPLAAHLAECPSCRSRIAVEECIKVVVARACPVPAPAHLRERVRAGLLQTRVGYSYTEVTSDREGTRVVQLSGYTEVVGVAPAPAPPRATLVFTVTEADTAVALGSGEVAVLGTPRLLAWCEAATVAAVAGALLAEETTVGVNVQLEHLAPSRVGTTVTVVAVLAAVGRRRLTFDCEATEDGTGTVLARGRITRVRVKRDAFG